MGARSSLLLIVLPLLAVRLPAQELAWPGFRGPTRDGIATAGVSPPLEWDDEKNLSWKTELPGPGSSSPIVVGDRVIVTCYSGYGDHLDDGGDPKKLKHHVVSLDRKTGRIAWSRKIDGALSREARKVILTQHGFASPTPICDGKALYVYFGDAGLAALDLDGKVLWRTDLGKPSPDAPPATNSVERGGRTILQRWGSAASPLLFENLVIVNASEQSNSLRAFDKATGGLVWTHESANLEGCATSPALVGKKASRLLVITLAGAVWAMDPGSGKLVWEVETETRGGMIPTPISDDDLVYAFGGGDEGFAIRYATPPADERASKGDDSRVAWSSGKLGIPSPVLHDGHVFLVDARGTAMTLNAKDGEVVFRGRLEGRTGGIYASPVLAADRLYVVSRRRGTFVYSADGEFDLLAHNELTDGSQFNASPALAGHQLFLRSDRYVYCLSDS